jgi:hypothetical protein
MILPAGGARFHRFGIRCPGEIAYDTAPRGIDGVPQSIQVAATMPESAGFLFPDCGFLNQSRQSEDKLRYDG